MAATLIDEYNGPTTSVYHQYGGAAVEYIGQSFKGLLGTTNFTLDSCQFFLQKGGTPTGNINAKLYSHTGTFGSTGVPLTLLATSDNFDISTLTTSSLTLTTFTFSGANRIMLSSGTPYCLEMSYTGGDSANYLCTVTDIAAVSPEGNFNYSADGSTWSYYAPYSVVCALFGIPLGPITTNANVLVVSGGGSGDNTSGGFAAGGGGGQVLIANPFPIINGLAYTVTVGAGGAPQNDGSRSSFGVLTAIGGHHGVGGTGGGTGGASGSGFVGGAADVSSGGGGGGDSAIGQTAPLSTVGGAGGAGTANSISGTSVTYGGGGGGGSSVTGGAGGVGGGGNGGNSPGNANATVGAANTGGGGGSVKAGGSGIIIVATPIGAITSATGGTHTTSGGNDIWTFTSSGTWTPTIPSSNNGAFLMNFL